jgi:hypothetical protein
MVIVPGTGSLCLASETAPPVKVAPALEAAVGHEPVLSSGVSPRVMRPGVEAAPTTGPPSILIPIFQAEPSVECVQHDGSAYLRLGSCNRCGACCRSGDPFVGEQTTPPTPCHKLGRDADAHVCTAWEDPWVRANCRAWPSAPAHIVAYPDCSYRFERVR